MSSKRPQPGRCLFDRRGALTLPTLTIFFVGCASPGPPRPPSLNLPALVTDLTAERSADRVLLRWTTPPRTTDDLPVQGIMTAQICRETGARPLTPAERLTACAPVMRLAVAAGTSKVSDTLSRPLNADPVALMTYRIRIVNAAGRSAGDSVASASVAAGEAPASLESFHATASEAGAILEWRKPQSEGKTHGGNMTYGVDIRMRDLSAAPPKQTAEGSAHPESGKSRRSKTAQTSDLAARAEVHLRVSDARNVSGETPEKELSGTVVPPAKMGNTYTFSADRVRWVTLGGHLFEIHSDPSPTVTLSMRDTFPPRAPSSLASIPSTTATAPYIDLSWQPNSEADLAGYFVYRQVARTDDDLQSRPVRVTPASIPTPAYRDVAVMPGQRYSYSVTAVDVSGNESAPSAQIQEALPSPF